MDVPKRRRSESVVCILRAVSGSRLTLFMGLLAILSVPLLEQGIARPATVGAARGDAARGARLFATLPCGSCHDITRPWPGGDICPNLGNIGTEAARIIRSREYRGKARNAAEYVRESIVNPNAYIVPGERYHTADGQSVMPKDFGQTLSASQLDDLVAFLLTHH